MAYSVDACWNGNVAEIIVYNRVLSTTELQEVHLYLATKYGLYMPGGAPSWINSYTPAVQAEINRNFWNRNQADAYVAFQNNNAGILTNGLRLWLRADAGVVTTGHRFPCNRMGGPDRQLFSYPNRGLWPAAPR